MDIPKITNTKIVKKHVKSSAFAVLIPSAPPPLLLVIELDGLVGIPSPPLPLPLRSGSGVGVPTAISDVMDDSTAIVVVYIVGKDL